MIPLNEYPYRNLEDFNLDYILKKLKGLESQISEVIEWKPEFEKMYNEIKAFIAQIESGNLPQGFIDAINKWMQENAIDLVGDLVKAVYFGLTNDGYFCAFIPEHWDWVTFDTITDPDEPLYGHLVLMYD
jgi:hypothetical protein